MFPKLSAFSDKFSESGSWRLAAGALALALSAWAVAAPKPEAVKLCQDVSQEFTTILLKWNKWQEVNILFWNGTWVYKTDIVILYWNNDLIKARPKSLETFVDEDGSCYLRNTNGVYVPFLSSNPKLTLDMLAYGLWWKDPNLTEWQKWGVAGIEAWLGRLMRELIDKKLLTEWEISPEKLATVISDFMKSNPKEFVTIGLDAGFAKDIMLWIRPNPGKTEEERKLIFTASYFTYNNYIQQSNTSWSIPDNEWRMRDVIITYVKKSPYAYLLEKTPLPDIRKV